MPKHNLRLVTDAVAIATENKKIKVKKNLTLKKRQDGRSPFWFAYISIKGKQKIVSTKCTDEVQARQVAIELEAKIKAEMQTGFSVFDKSFADVAEDFLSSQKQRLFDGEYSQSSYERDVKLTNTYLLPFFTEKKMKVSKITRVVLNEFRTFISTHSVSGKKLKSATRRKIEDLLGAILKFAEDRGFIKERPLFTKTKAVSSETPHFTKEQFRTMMRKLKEYIEIASNKRDANSRQMMYYALSILSQTGLRPHELLRMTYNEKGKTYYTKGLRWKNVKFYTDDENGKHSVDLYITPENDKNRKGRVVPAGKSVYFILSKLHSMANDTQKTIGTVFETDYRSAFPRFLDWAKMRVAPNGENYTMYSLRHTYITWHTEDKPTSNPSQLSHVTGNSVTTIERYYDKASVKNFRSNFI